MNKQEYIDYFGEIITIQEALDRFYEVARHLKQKYLRRRIMVKVNTIKETKTYYRPKELCCTDCKYSIGMGNSYDIFCVVDDDIKSGRDKEQCPFYK